MSPLLPVARRHSLIIKELPDETLVYDLETDKAHCLNRTAALVWKQCDGEHTFEDLVNGLPNEVGVEVGRDVVRLALSQLQKFNLIESDSISIVSASVMSRRSLGKHLGQAALALPVILSIVTPTAAQTASQCAPATGKPNGCPCGNNADCASGTCTNAPPKICVP